MKIIILFISLLIVNVNAIYSNLTCEDHFDVSHCNECQQEVWNFRSNALGCGFFVIKNVCSADFSCGYEDVKKKLQNVEEKCSNELSTFIDWSANPLVLDHNVVSAYATIILYYFAVPEHNSICHKASSGELCGVESIKPLVEWLRQEIPEGKVHFSYDYSYVFKDDETRIEIPLNLVTNCGECGKNMIKEYKAWTEKFAIPDVILNNVFRNSLEGLLEYYSCPLIL
ncbi:hypothetical protein GLOIN_2v1846162 [Rhizophagus clarus]|uniref:Niemann-Pick C1 N-terminal domain-containing protein n=1 Tax=Rhizophagus clarus TaxID=94130 RepID=A0A8H3L9J1_9GLOM|nr:hypothetical protein GLOIN_2v1846162 [Rhizophagus clarus]